MSRLNKVNKDHYNQRGRLTPDELARERAAVQPPPPRPTRTTGAPPAQRPGRRAPAGGRPERGRG